MDSGSVTASNSDENKPSKRQKSNEDEDEGEGEDMISNLPDFVIGCILSLLPTKDAVRTSVLSKRWIYLWTFITKLRFKDKKHYSSKKIRKRCFCNFVLSVLRHLNSSSIQSFSLTISEEYDPSHINEWISAALNRRVKKLSVYSQKNLNLSSLKFFECQSLEKLVLTMAWMVCCVVRVPTFFCLSSLTVLKFSGIRFTCYFSNDSKNLTLNFPVLRKYETINCTWSGVKCVTFEVPLLEVVTIYYSPSECLLPSDESYTEIKFCASRLAQFTYDGYMLPVTILLDLSTAHISATITPYRYMKQSMKEMGILACKLLKQLNNNVECLTFHQSRILAQAKDSLAALPAFGMLSHLELTIVTGEILLELLLKTPFLKTLVLSGMIQFDKELLNSAIVPDCLLCTLQVVKFKSVRGDEHELSLAKFVTENALVIERMSFFVPPWIQQGSNFKKLVSFKEKLLSFKKGSSFVSVEFSTDCRNL